MNRILFVCTGNTCRSPMAEAMLRSRAAAAGLRVEVRSAGISTLDGLPVSTQAIETLRKRRIDHQAVSRALTAEQVGWADLVLTMTTNHKRHVLERYPQAVDKTYTLREYANSGSEVVAAIEELEALYTELHMKQALGNKLTDEERSRLIALEGEIPSFDIADPFGGSLEQYGHAADEIEAAIEQLVEKLAR